MVTCPVSNQSLPSVATFVNAPLASGAPTVMSGKQVEDGRTYEPTQIKVGDGASSFAISALASVGMVSNGTQFTVSDPATDHWVISGFYHFQQKDDELESTTRQTRTDGGAPAARPCSREPPRRLDCT